MSSMSATDYVIFCAVLVVSLVIGFFYAWKGRKVTQEEQTKAYLTGGTKMSLIPVSLSFVATMISSIVVLGIPAEVYAHSIQYWIANISALFAAISTDVLFLGMFYELKLTSINKYLLKRFNYPSLRIVSSLAFNITGVFISGTIVYGPALAISSVTPMSIDVSIVIVGLVCALYTAAGGIQAVIWTDVLQLAIMVAGMLMVGIQGTITGGGWSSVWEKAEEGKILQWFNYDYDDVYGTPTFWEVVLGFYVLWAGGLSTNQMCVQRYCNLPSLRQARISLYLGTILTAAFLLLSQYCGVILYANYYKCDPLMTGELFSPDQLMPYYVMKELSYIPGLAGIFVATVFSGSLSTLSSVINATTVLIWDDFLKRRIRISPKKEIFLIKTLAVVFGLIVTSMGFIAKRMGSVLHVVLILIGGIVGPMYAIFFLGAVVPFVDGMSAMIAFIVGLAVSISYSIAAMVIPRPMLRFPTWTDECPVSNSTMLFSPAFNSTVNAMGTPQNIVWIHKIAPAFMPVICFLVSIAAGIICSYFTGGMKPDDVEPRYVAAPLRPYLIRKQKKSRNTQELGLVDSRGK